MLITFCGIDGSGKSSHVESTAKWLNEIGKESVSLSPIKYKNDFFNEFIEARTIYKELYRKELSDEVEGIMLAFQFFSQCKKINSIIAKDIVVVADRWIYSHYAYMYARNVKSDFINCMLENCPKPDLVFLLDIPVMFALERIDQRGERGYNEKKIILERARSKYLEFAEKENFIILNSKDDFFYNQKIIEDAIMQRI